VQYEIFPVTRYRQNCSVLWCEETGRAAVIDPGGDISSVLNFVDMMDFQLELVLVTHGHFDHCGSAARLAEMTGARIEGPHRSEAPTVAKLPEQSAQFAGLDAANDRAIGDGKKDRAANANPVRSYLPSRWLRDGDVASFGNVGLEVLHCPGHTPGHVAYFNRSERLAFVGDILFRGTIGAWEHPQGDLAQLIGSIRRKLFVLGDDVAFVPGHGPMSTIGRERQDNPFVGDGAYVNWLARFPDRAGTEPQAR